MRDATSRVEFRDEELSVSRDDALDRRGELRESEDGEAGGKDVTREMVVSCVARAGSRRALNEKVDAYLARLTHVPLDGRGITAKLEVIGSVCPGVRVLYLYDNKITKMAGLARLSRLTHLHLQNNRLTSIEGLGKCEHLEKLYVDGNCLREISGLEACVNLRALHASNQKKNPDSSGDSSDSDTSLRFDQASLDAVAGALTHLDVSSCRFLDAKALGALAKLETANLANCGLESLAELEPALALCAKLRHVDVRGNPLAKDPRHAARVAVLGEGLRTVNGVEVTTRERLFLTRLERRRERTSRDRASHRLGPGDETREKTQKTRRRRCAASTRTSTTSSTSRRSPTWARARWTTGSITRGRSRLGRRGTCCSPGPRARRRWRPRRGRCPGDGATSPPLRARRASPRARAPSSCGACRARWTARALSMTSLRRARAGWRFRGWRPRAPRRG